MVLKTKLNKLYSKTEKYICMGNLNNNLSKYDFFV